MADIEVIKAPEIKPPVTKPHVKTFKFFGHDNNVFRSGLECITKCPFDGVVNFELHRDVADKLEYLQGEVRNDEFLVYGNAKLVNNKYILEDVIIPKQKAGHAEINDIAQKHGIQNTVIHKHPGDEPYGFSANDIETVNNNHTFSLIIGGRNLYKIIGSARVKTDCGKYFMCNMNITIGKRSISDPTFVASVKNIQTQSMGRGFLDKALDAIFGKVDEPVSKVNRQG